MRRWNGWGDELIEFPVPETALQYLAAALGESQPYPDISMQEILRRLPESKLISDSRVFTNAEERLRHSRGQSLADWVALRSGQVGCFPDGVAYARSEEDLRDLMTLARNSGAVLIPYGGGTSVVGHINPLPDY